MNNHLNFKKLMAPILFTFVLSTAFATPLTTKPDISNTLAQCLANVPIVGNGAGSSPICHATGALGTAAFANTGTSGATLGFLNTANTYLTTQTFTVSPVFTDQSGSRTALGLGTAAVQNIGTSGANVPLLNSANTIGAIWTFGSAPVFNALPTGTAVATANTISTLVSRDASGNFSAGTITAALSGNATTSTTATNATNGSTIATTTNASFFPLFAASSTNSNQPFNLDTTFTYNPSTDTLTATNFAGNATTATAATNTAIIDDTTTNATVYPTWVTANTGNLPQKVTSTKLSFNPSTGALSSTSFIGTLTSVNFANPSGSAGLTAVNGSAVTAMRSDGAPAISQSIAPIWTGIHTFGSAGYPTLWSGTGAGDVIQIGGTSLNGSATPDTLNLGGDYSSTAGANPKLKLLGVASNIYGIGVSVGLMDFIVPSAASFAFYPNASGAALANITTVGDFRSTPRTVGTLGTCNGAAEGTRAGVTDALAPTFLGTLVGGGTVHTSAYCNGTNWVGG